MVLAGVTLPLAALLLKPVLVHAYEVAAGVQLAVKVEDAPALIALGDALKVHCGTPALTVKIVLAVLPLPLLLLPMTEYVVVAFGATVPLATVLPKPELVQR